MALIGGRYGESVPTTAPCGTMTQEAKAVRKAHGYADVGPAVWKVLSESNGKEESTARQPATG
jgi:hypothetical protein